MKIKNLFIIGLFVSNFILGCNGEESINTPQVGILGMHAIQERPVNVNGKVEIRPMMYLALSYDHRIIDGRQAVTFLKHIKEYVEDPERILFGI